MVILLDAAAGFVCGIISGLGIGGGTVLMLYLLYIAKVPQLTAQGINLIYFLPTASASLISHFKNGLVEKKALLPAIIAGSVCAALSSLFAASSNTDILRRLFGIFLILTGTKEFFRK